MPREELIKPKPKQISQEQWERIIAVEMGPNESSIDLIHYIKDPNRQPVPESEKGWFRFIIQADNFNLYLSYKTHFWLLNALKIQTEDCLISDGVFKFDADTKKLDFLYTWGNKPEATNLRATAEKKIKEFLKARGLEISN